MPTIRSFDGTEITYQDTGGSGRAIVLANGLGGTWSAWRYFHDYFADDHRIVSWDYRGLYGSGSPATDAFAIEDHARDLRAVVEATDVEDPVLAGWSMGVAVITEYVRHWDDEVGGLLPMCGSPGKVFETTRLGILQGAIRPTAKLLSRLDGPLTLGLKASLGLPGGPRILQRVGLVSEALDVEAFTDLAHEFTDLDFATYFAIFEELGRYDGWDVLPHVEVPALVIAAEKDLFTPVRVHERMARALPEGELFVVRTGTHYAPVEFPEVLNLRVEKFLRERVETPVRVPVAAT